MAPNASSRRPNTAAKVRGGADRARQRGSRTDGDPRRRAAPILRSCAATATPRPSRSMPRRTIRIRISSPFIDRCRPIAIVWRQQHVVRAQPEQQLLPLLRKPGGAGAAAPAPDGKFVYDEPHARPPRAGDPDRSRAEMRDLWTAFALVLVIEGLPLRAVSRRHEARRGAGLCWHCRPQVLRDGRPCRRLCTVSPSSGWSAIETSLISASVSATKCRRCESGWLGRGVLP